MSFKKFFAAGAVAVLAAVGLSACTSHVGAAAFVGDHRISDKTVGKYVTKVGPDAANANRSNPRISALNELIQAQIFTDALAKSGGVPTDAQLVALKETARTNLVTDQQGNPYDDATLLKLSKSIGLNSGFASLILRTAELEWAYIQQSKVTNSDELMSSIIKFNIPVTVAGKYGSWDQTNLAVNTSAMAGKPSFVTLPQLATSSQAAAAQG